MKSQRVRRFEWGARGEGPQVVHERVWTAANAISFIRLLGLPLFAWLLLAQEAFGWASVVLGVVGATDWVDGYVARRFDQVTKLGKVLDPLIDRALLATAAVSMLAAGMIPWWWVALVVGRDVALLAGAAVVFRSIPPISVTRIGKFATACLLLALPGILLGHTDWAAAPFILAGAWGVAALGTVAYYAAGVQYVQAALALRSPDR